MIEEFRSIEGFNEYKISNLGRVVSSKYSEHRKMNPSKVKSGYLKVALRKNGKSYQKYVHRLVAETFLGHSDLIVNHKDGNKENNKLSNLEFVTYSQNIQHAYDTKLMENSFRGNQWVDKFGKMRLKP